MNDNTPIYGCSGCSSTIGRAGCIVHGPTPLDFAFEPSPRACVVGYITDGKGRVLLGRHTKRGSSYGRFVLPGGGIHLGESIEQALRREIREECSLELDHVGQVLGVYRHVEPPVPVMMRPGIDNLVVLVKAMAFGVPVGGSDLAEPAFFGMGAVVHMDITPATCDLLDMARGSTR